MSIKLRCPQCAQKYAAHDAMAGKELMCPGCGAAIKVPADGSGAAGDSAISAGGSAQPASTTAKAEVSPAMARQLAKAQADKSSAAPSNSAPSPPAPVKAASAKSAPSKPAQPADDGDYGFADEEPTDELQEEQPKIELDDVEVSVVDDKLLDDEYVVAKPVESQFVDDRFSDEEFLVKPKQPRTDRPAGNRGGGGGGRLLSYDDDDDDSFSPTPRGSRSSQMTPFDYLKRYPLADTIGAITLIISFGFLFKGFFLVALIYLAVGGLLTFFGFVGDPYNPRRNSIGWGFFRVITGVTATLLFGSWVYMAVSLYSRFGSDPERSAGIPAYLGMVFSIILGIVAAVAAVTALFNLMLMKIGPFRAMAGGYLFVSVLFAMPYMFLAKGGSAQSQVAASNDEQVTQSDQADKSKSDNSKPAGTAKLPTGVIKPREHPAEQSREQPFEEPSLSEWDSVLEAREDQERNKNFNYHDLVSETFIYWIAQNNQTILNKVQLFPGVKRPTTGLRVGIGAYNGQSPQKISYQPAGSLKSQIGPVGSAVEKEVFTHWDKEAFGHWAAPNSLRLTAPIATYLSMHEEDLLADAAELNLDLVVTISLIPSEPIIRETTSTAVQLRIVDVLTQKTLWSAEPFNALGPITFTKKDDAVTKAVGELAAQFDSRFTAKAVPEVTRAQVQARVKDIAVGNLPMEYALRALIEIRYYHAKGLLSSDEAKVLYDTILGDGRGAKLYAGTAIQRKKLLRKWLMPDVR